MEQDLIDAVLQDWQTAPVRPELRAMLGFLHILTLTPNLLGPGDLDVVRRAGVSDDAVRDASYVCALFSTITRLADALDWDVPADFSGSKVSLVKFGYRLPPGL
jgi:alkylhydroperoxidase family enzyme